MYVTYVQLLCYVVNRLNYISMTFFFILEMSYSSSKNSNNSSKSNLNSKNQSSYDSLPPTTIVFFDWFVNFSSL